MNSNLEFVFFEERKQLHRRLSVPFFLRDDAEVLVVDVVEDVEVDVEVLLRGTFSFSGCLFVEVIVVVVNDEDINEVFGAFGTTSELLMLVLLLLVLLFIIELVVVVVSFLMACIEVISCACLK
jgi:hypothetical protein